MRTKKALARQTEVRWSQLRPYRFITAGMSSGNRLLLDRAFEADWRPKAFYEVWHLSSSLGLVEAGLGWWRCRPRRTRRSRGADW